MFGYVRPCRPEMKCRDFDLYRATYCGLCRCLREHYGMIAPMLLNFDFTFLALLLWEPEEEFHPCKGRCHANLLLKKEMCPESPALKQAAAESMILAYWKLRDSVEDDGFWGGMPARALSVLLRRAYRRAARDCPEFDRAVRCSFLNSRTDDKQRSVDTVLTQKCFSTSYIDITTSSDSCTNSTIVCCKNQISIIRQSLFLNSAQQLTNDIVGISDHCTMTFIIGLCIWFGRSIYERSMC